METGYRHTQEGWTPQSKAEGNKLDTFREEDMGGPRIRRMALRVRRTLCKPQHGGGKAEKVVSNREGEMANLLF